MSQLKVLGLCSLLVLATGCAVGNKYDYQQADIGLPLKGNGGVGLGVLENREYVLNGKKEANFIGLQRGGFGNPFNVTTASGDPLTEDMYRALSTALTNSGFSVSKLDISSADATVVAEAVSKDGRERNVVLVVTDWKTDVYANVKLIYDLTLQVLEKDGTVIASNQSKGEESLGGAGFGKHNSTTAASAFELKVSRLFNTPEIVQALSGQ